MERLMEVCGEECTVGHFKSREKKKVKKINKRRRASRNVSDLLQRVKERVELRCKILLYIEFTLL